MRHSKAEKAATHSKIVAVAARRFRELGLNGIGVADVMKEAGSSVGGFYKHFNSRDELVIEALAEAFKDLDRWEQEAEDLPALLRFYLGEEHRDCPEAGCAITALAGDIRHASKGVKAVYTERVKHSLAYTADRMEGGDAASRRARAILSLSAGIGGLALARAVNDKTLSREILAALRDQLIALAKQPQPIGAATESEREGRSRSKRD
jgi:TetR/AcrR family transcriptional regulator, transcriptional repressor for nem operon